MFECVCPYFRACDALGSGCRYDAGADVQELDQEEHSHGGFHGGGMPDIFQVSSGCCWCVRLRPCERLPLVPRLRCLAAWAGWAVWEARAFTEANTGYLPCVCTCGTVFPCARACAMFN